MKLLYATSITFPSTRANRIQIMQMAKAFGKVLGKNFVLGISFGKEVLDQDIEILEMGKGLRSFQFAWKYLAYAKESGVDLILCREEKMLFFLTVFNILFFHLPVKFFYEIHHLIYLRKIWNRLMLSRVTGIISLTHAMKDSLFQAGYDKKPILVAPDAVDIGMFSVQNDRDAARETLGLPKDKKIVIYTGSIDEPWKGVEVLYESSKLVDDSMLYVVVGGKPHYVDYFNVHNPPRDNFLLLGQKPHDDIPTYLAAADVLVLPNSGKSEISTISTSPMKLFEYMASGRPIVASDTPSLREILNDTNATIVSPDDPRALALGIEEAVRDRENTELRARQARTDVERHTWDKRAHDIVLFLNTPHD